MTQSSKPARRGRRSERPAWRLEAQQRQQAIAWHRYGAGIALGKLTAHVAGCGPCQELDGRGPAVADCPARDELLARYVQHAGQLAYYEARDRAVPEPSETLF